jgi:predicted nucleic acid-binding protein
MTTYFDTSALVAVYVTEALSAVARREVARAGSIPFTALHELELGNALQLLRGRRLIDAAELEQLSLQVAEDRTAQRLVHAPVDLHRVFEHARELSARHTSRLLCRSLDVLHVSNAVALGSTRLVSADDRQLALARTLGLGVTDIKKRAGSGRRR